MPNEHDEQHTPANANPDAEASGDEYIDALPVDDLEADDDSTTNRTTSIPTTRMTR
jgi:hypothetical protein